jgi:hypothetical protein
VKCEGERQPTAGGPPHNGDTCNTRRQHAMPYILTVVRSVCLQHHTIPHHTAPQPPLSAGRPSCALHRPLTCEYVANWFQ